MSPQTQGAEIAIDVDIVSWNYRIVSIPVPARNQLTGEPETLHVYAVYEAYYGAHSIEPECIGPRAIGPMGTDMEILAEDLALMAEAMKKPVIDFTTTPHLVQELAVAKRGTYRD